jgi:hypothetical protein
MIISLLYNWQSGTVVTEDINFSSLHLPSFEGKVGAEVITQGSELRENPCPYLSVKYFYFCLYHLGRVVQVI